MAIIVDLDLLIAKRGMTIGEFAEAVGITPANIAVLKNGRAKAVRFTTLDAICRILECQPGDVLRWMPDETDQTGETA
ncbi:helix-turn-helix transcriptional regulator [Glycomyces sp. NRRL B-16210]|uniref:helix-turn-helix domain-containing protein n=1 Tax=Glycomyces sp. NRRL B-16210 TaxID=1463821 RepID=UPI0004BE6EFF|nr:helix-turn-helix transcriptional regulator [Glycomyces sp. NRRL B-16210]